MNRTEQILESRITKLDAEARKVRKPLKGVVLMSRKQKSGRRMKPSKYFKRCKWHNQLVGELRQLINEYNERFGTL